MKRIESLGEFLLVWRSVVDHARLDFTVGRRLASDPAGTMRQFGYELAPAVHRALVRSVR
jgi:hypothetical protein